MNNSTKTILVILVAVMLLAASFGSGALVGATVKSQAFDKLVRTPENTLTPIQPTLPTPQGQAASTPIVSELTPDEQKELFAPFWESWKLLHENYVDQPLDDLKLMRGAISGMLAATGDKHTSYMDPEQFKQANTSMEGEYEGIGAWVDITGDYLSIISPMPGSPAEKGGLKPEDKVIAVDGEDMTGIDGNLVLRRILGPAGTTVTLKILRGEETFEISLVREKINIASVEGKMLEDDIAYVALLTFADKTDSELRNALQDVMAQNPKGLILDLRNNGGGYLNTAIEVVSEFLPANQVAMYEEFGDNTRKTFKTSRGGLATEIPLVVLINGGTASASEITAGAIQDYGRGVLVGTTTFGKGSVQNWVALKNDQGAVRVTIARWLTPKERLIQKVGLEPDVVVELTEENIKDGKDIQLEKAIEILSSPTSLK